MIRSKGQNVEIQRARCLVILLIAFQEKEKRERCLKKAEH